MSDIVVSFTDYEPPARFDSIPWTQARIDQADASTGPWTTIDTITFADPDPDPATPAERSFTTPYGTAPDLWYQVTFVDDDGNVSTATDPVQNSVAGGAYATTADLFRVLKVRTPSDAQEDAAQGDLDTATIEINAELDWAADHAPATPEQRELFKGVCIDRAADLWRHRESIPGVLGGLDDVVPTPGRYSWARYVARLSVAKDQFGVA
jgi:hypothetical protein